MTIIRIVKSYVPEECFSENANTIIAAMYVLNIGSTSFIFGVFPAKLNGIK